MAEVLESLDDVEFEGDSDLLIASRDFEKIADARINSGYLEGVEAGKQQGVEEGFHHGFRRGLENTVHWSLLRGKISALQAHCSKLVEKDNPSSIHHQVNLQLSDLLKVVTEREKKRRDKTLAEETMAYQSSQLASSTTQGATAAAGDASAENAILKDLMLSRSDLPCPELLQLQKRLEELRSQLTS